MSARPTTFVVGAAFLIIGVAPLAAALLFSFAPLDGSTVGSGSLDGYRTVFAGGRLAELAQVIARAAAATAIAVSLAIPTAFHLRQIRNPSIQLALLSLLLAPWLVSDMLRAFGWQLALSPAGPVSTAWAALSGGRPLEGLRYNHFAALAGLVSATLPTAVLGTFAALPRPDSSEWQAAREIGSPRHVFALLALGRARPGIAFGTCMTFLLCLFASAEPQFLDGPTQTSMLTIASSLSNVGVSALMAFGMTMLLLAACACFGFFLLWRAHRTPRGSVRTPGAESRGPIRRSRSSVIGAALLDVAAKRLPVVFTAIALLLCLCPLVAVSVEAFRQPTMAGSVWTLDNFQLLLESPDLTGALGRSAVLAIVVAALTVASGFVLSLTVWEPRRAGALLLTMLGLVLLPGEVYALGLLQVAKALGWEEGAPFLVAIAHLIWILPFSTGSLMLANSAIGRSVIEAALELGRTPSAVAREVVGRINRGAIAGSAMLALTLSLNENVRASYLGGSLPSLANAVYGRLQTGLLPENRGIFAVEFLLVVGAMLSALLMLKTLSTASRR